MVGVLLSVVLLVGFCTFVGIGVHMTTNYN